MRVKLNSPRDIVLLRYGKYLPRAIRTANPQLGSWVSPTYINFPNRMFKSDSVTLRGRLKHTPDEKTTIDVLAKEAFQEKWFNWRLLSKGQVTKYDRVENLELPRILLLNIESKLFDGESGYRRYLTLAAIIEYFYTLYDKRFRVVFIVNCYNKREKRSLYTRYNQQLKSNYFIAKSVGLLGSLSLLSKIYKTVRTKTK